MLESFALFYGIVGTTTGLMPYFKKLKKWLSAEATHEKIIFECYKKALKDVTGEDLSRFRLKGDVAILDQIDQYFKKNDVRTASNYIDKFLCSLNIDLETVRKRFEHHLAEAGSSEVLTYISLRTLEGTKRVERRLSELADRFEEIVIPKAPELPKGIPVAPTPYFAHPYPLQANFTGRESERKELTEWFTKSREPMFAYVAIGGMGKSALTWYWLQEDIIKQGLAPEGIIWWSFYDREARFETFLMKAIQYASKGEVDVKEIASTRDRMDCLYSLLCNNQFLLVLDGVERVLRAYAGLGSPYQGDEVTEDKKQEFRTCIDPNVGTFLQWLASGNVKTKTLLTSRLCPKELDNIAGCLHKELKEMDEEDAVNFFHRQEVKGTRAEIEGACDPFGYHPLSLRLLSGMIIKDPKYMGDIKAWTKYNPLHELKGKEHNILELAYNSLDKKKQVLLSKLSAFRNPMDYNSILIFFVPVESLTRQEAPARSGDLAGTELGTEEKFDQALIELVDRGLLLRDVESNKYDLHPIVRKYCYEERLLDKKGVHSQLRDYFAAVPKPKKIESLDDLAPVIELYHHTVRSRQYEPALALLEQRLLEPLYYQFAAYQLAIDFLLALIPEGDDKPARLKDDAEQGWTLNMLGNCYALSGQPVKALPLLEKAVHIQENVVKHKENLGVCLSNLALNQTRLGDVRTADSNLRRVIELFQEGHHKFDEAVGQQELGRLFAYEGRFEESEKELAKSTKHWEEINNKEGICRDETYRALRALLMSDTDQALKSAKWARELADVKKGESDIIWAEWLLGASHLVKGDLKEAEKHLNEALVRDRRINLVELESDILLELAKLRFKQGHKEEALKLAEEALGIAERSEYRLKQADIHNFLAEFYIETNDFPKAKEHIEIAKERAACGYKPAMDKAEELAERIDQKS